jgi:hypothetical protein
LDDSSLHWRSPEHSKATFPTGVSCSGSRLFPPKKVERKSESGDHVESFSGALLKAYEAGTTTPVQIYSDEALTTAHSGIANASGVFAPAYMAAGEYKFDMLEPSTLESLPG